MDVREIPRMLFASVAEHVRQVKPGEQWATASGGTAHPILVLRESEYRTSFSVYLTEQEARESPLGAMATLSAGRRYTGGYDPDKGRHYRITISLDTQIDGIELNTFVGQLVTDLAAQVAKILELNQYKLGEGYENEQPALAD